MDGLELLHPDGLFLRHEAREHGLSDRDLRAAVADRVLVRVRQGAYVDHAVWSQAGDLGRHRIAARAVMLTHEGRVALSHVSGAAMHGLRIWGADLSKVHVTRLDGQSGRQTHNVVHHSGGWAADEVVEREGLYVMSARQCAVGTAMTASIEAGLVCVDSAYDLGLVDREDIQEAARVMAGWPGSARLQVTLRLAQPGAESVGESRVRYLCWAHHLPKPVLQYEVVDEAGTVVGRTDFAWPEQELLGEFDGRVKYGRFLRPGEAPADAVFREKVREDRIREITGWRMIRLSWSDLSEPLPTAERLRRALSNGAGRSR